MSKLFGVTIKGDSLQPNQFESINPSITGISLINMGVTIIIIILPNMRGI